MGVCLAAMIGAGCGHGSAADQTAGAEHATSSTFAQAYESVKSGGRSTARWGEWVIDKTENGAVRVYRAARAAAERAPDALPHKHAGSPAVIRRPSPSTMA